MLGDAVLDYGEPYHSPDTSLVDSSGQEEEYCNDNDGATVSQQTPIHLAIVNQHEAVVEAFIQHKGTSLW